jgi:hypothetical protein
LRALICALVIACGANAALVMFPLKVFLGLVPVVVGDVFFLVLV